MSWWNDDTGFNVVVQTAMKDAAVKVIRTGDTIDISANVYFQYCDPTDEYFVDYTIDPSQTLDITYAEAIMAGIEKYWSGTYSINGKSVQVNTSLNLVSKKSGQNYVRFIIMNEDYGVSCATGGVLDGWSITAGTYVKMYRGYNSDQYTLDKFMRTAAHEFGHVLGVDDAYESLDGVRPETEIVSNGDLMLNQFSAASPLSSWDVAMVMQAYTTNSWQYWESYNGHTQSSIINYYVCK